MQTLLTSLRRNSMGVVLALACVFALLPGAALAAPTAAAYEGTGALTCEGVGTAALVMGGKLHVDAQAPANMQIRHANQIAANGAGKRVDYGLWTYLFGWQGQVEVTGAHFFTHIAGETIAIYGYGQGPCLGAGNRHM